MRTVRDAAFDVLRMHGLTTIFANPGSTEISLLADLPEDLNFVLARPVLVVGAGADSTEGWAALTALAQRLNCAVWQEPFGERAGFPQDHTLFAGHLPAERARLRDVLAPYDLVV